MGDATGFHRRLLSPNALSQMFGRVAQWRLRARNLRWEARGRGLPGEWRATRPTELGPRQILSPTLGTPRLERHTTLNTKLRLFRIVRATAEAVHAASLLLRARQGKENTQQGRFDNCRPRTR